jgi:hypothetical protein
MTTVSNWLLAGFVPMVCELPHARYSWDGPKKYCITYMNMIMKYWLSINLDEQAGLLAQSTMRVSCFLVFFIFLHCIILLVLHLHLAACSLFSDCWCGAVASGRT